MCVSAELSASRWSQTQRLPPGSTQVQGQSKMLTQPTQGWPLCRRHYSTRTPGACRQRSGGSSTARGVPRGSTCSAPRSCALDRNRSTGAARGGMRRITEQTDPRGLFPAGRPGIGGATGGVTPPLALLSGHDLSGGSGGRASSRTQTRLPRDHRLPGPGTLGLSRPGFSHH